MAQHISIKAFPQKVFKRILASIVKDFERQAPRGSLKYDFRNYYSHIYKEHEGEEVCFTNRYIGNGFVYGSQRGEFEIHFDKKTNKINQIYLVA